MDDLIERMKKCNVEDIEYGHIMADDILIEALIRHREFKLVEEFKKTSKVVCLISDLERFI